MSYKTKLAGIALAVTACVMLSACNSGQSNTSSVQIIDDSKPSSMTEQENAINAIQGLSENNKDVSKLIQNEQLITNALVNNPSANIQTQIEIQNQLLNQQNSNNNSLIPTFIDPNPSPTPLNTSIFEFNPFSYMADFLQSLMEPVAKILSVDAGGGVVVDVPPQTESNKFVPSIRSQLQAPLDVSRSLFKDSLQGSTGPL